MSLLLLEQILEAKRLLSTNSHIRRTPLLQHVEQFSPSLQQLGMKNLCFKLENMQCTGSFKIRGIIYKLLQEKSEDEKTIVSMSGGNFARSISYAAKHFNRKVVLFMPETVPQDRIAYCQSMGAQVHLCSTFELQSKVHEYVKQHPNTYFEHPFDSIQLITGYSTIGHEIIEDLSEEQIDMCVVNCGGGGLLSGVASALRLLSKNPNLQIIGVEPENSPSMYLSLQENKPVILDSSTSAPTICSGLAPPYAGSLTFEFVKQFVNQIVLVSEAEVKQALQIVAKDCKLIVEPSGVACVAACLSGKLGDLQTKTVVLVLSGGNINLNDLNKFIDQTQ